MLTQQTIVLIGSGCTGKILAGVLSDSDYVVLLCDESFPKAVALATEVVRYAPGSRVEAMECIFDGAWEADIVILALPLAMQLQLAHRIKEVVNQKILLIVNDEEEGLVKDPASMAGHQQQLLQLLPNTAIFQLMARANGVVANGHPGFGEGYSLRHDIDAIAPLSQRLQTAGWHLLLPPSR